MSVMSEDEARALGYIGLPRRMNKAERLQQSALLLLAARNRLIAAKLELSAAKLAVDAGEDRVSAGYEAAAHEVASTEASYARARQNYEDAIAAVSPKREVPAVPFGRVCENEMAGVVL